MLALTQRYQNDKFDVDMESVEKVANSKSGKSYQQRLMAT
jgi:hypothetical protein